jgi:hypothetical protein
MLIKLNGSQTASTEKASEGLAAHLKGITKVLGTPHLCGSPWRAEKVACPGASPSAA